MKTWRHFLYEEDGPTATEYAVMLSIMIMAIALTVKLLGMRVRGNIANSAATINTVVD